MEALVQTLKTLLGGTPSWIAIQLSNLWGWVVLYPGTVGLFCAALLLASYFLHRAAHLRVHGTFWEQRRNSYGRLDDYLTNEGFFFGLNIAGLLGAIALIPVILNWFAMGLGVITITSIASATSIATEEGPVYDRVHSCQEYRRTQRERSDDGVRSRAKKAVSELSTFPTDDSEWKRMQSRINLFSGEYIEQLLWLRAQLKQVMMAARAEIADTDNPERLDLERKFTASYKLIESIVSLLDHDCEHTLNRALFASSADARNQILATVDEKMDGLEAGVQHLMGERIAEWEKLKADKARGFLSRMLFTADEGTPTTVGSRVPQTSAEDPIFGDGRNENDIRAAEEEVEKHLAKAKLQPTSKS